MAEVYELTENVANKTIELRKTYKTKLPDAIIAATALENQFTILTRNTIDFEKINGLEVINPHTL